MAKQTKLGLLAISIILGVACYVAYDKLGLKSLESFGISMIKGSGADGELLQTPEGQTLRPTGQSEDPFGDLDGPPPPAGSSAFDGVRTAQNEPDIDDHNHGWAPPGRSDGRGTASNDWPTAPAPGNPPSSHGQAIAQNSPPFGRTFGQTQPLPQPTTARPITTDPPAPAAGGDDPFGSNISNPWEAPQRTPPVPTGSRTASAPPPGNQQRPGWDDLSAPREAPRPIQQTGMRDAPPADIGSGQSSNSSPFQSNGGFDRNPGLARTASKDAPPPSTGRQPPHPLEQADPDAFAQRGSQPFGSDSTYPRRQYPDAPAPEESSSSDPSRHRGNWGNREPPPPASNTQTYDPPKTPTYEEPRHRGGWSHREPPLPGGTGDSYIVRKHDTFWSISRGRYGTPRYFLALARFNQGQVPNPKTMRPGTVISVPSTTVLESHFSDLIPTLPRDRTPGGSMIPVGFFVDSHSLPRYKVGKGDTLSGIANKHLGNDARWTQIYAINREILENPHKLKIGTVLSLPRDAREFSVANQPGYYR